MFNSLAPSTARCRRRRTTCTNDGFGHWKIFVKKTLAMAMLTGFEDLSQSITDRCSNCEGLGTEELPFFQFKLDRPTRQNGRNRRRECVLYVWSVHSTRTIFMARAIQIRSQMDGRSSWVLALHTQRRSTPGSTLDLAAITPPAQPMMIILLMAPIPGHCWMEIYRRFRVGLEFWRKIRGGAP